MALKATKEGPRKILIASSRCHNIHVRDAISGLLLRTIEVPDKLTIYSILLDGGQLFCGTNKNLVFRYEFTVKNFLYLTSYFGMNESISILEWCRN